MTTKTNDKTKKRLLTAPERHLLSQIAAKEPPYSQRAQALLAIDDGATQLAASQLAGLTIGQVRYWLGRYRAERASIFPPEVLAQPIEETAHSPQKTKDDPLSPADSPDLAEIAAAEEVQEEIVLTAEADATPAPPKDTPPAGKKSKKKGKKRKRDKEGGKEKKSKKKKRGKGKKKKGKGKKSREKDAKGKSGKKKKKKSKK